MIRRAECVCVCERERLFLMYQARRMTEWDATGGVNPNKALLMGRGETNVVKVSSIEGRRRG